MTDQSVDLQASDVFGLGGSFIAQSSTIATSLDYASMLKANGDWEKWSSTFNQLDEVTVTYKYNSDTGLGAALPEVGSISNSYCITEISVETVYNDYPTITVTGHNHDENAHAGGKQREQPALPSARLA